MQCQMTQMIMTVIMPMSLHANNECLPCHGPWRAKFCLSQAFRTTKLLTHDKACAAMAWLGTQLAISARWSSCHAWPGPWRSSSCIPGRSNQNVSQIVCFAYRDDLTKMSPKLTVLDKFGWRWKMYYLWGNWGHLGGELEEKTILNSLMTLIIGSMIVCM